MAVVLREARILSYFQDGSRPGHLHLIPSRELALQANALGVLDRYLGTELTIPLQVEVTTVPGELLSREHMSCR
jgi:hypothetical protein